MKQVLVIPGRLDGLNEYTNACRGHWSKGYKMKKANEETVLWAIRASKLKPMGGKVNIVYRWFERPDPNNGAMRDKDNIRFAAKYINDALQKAGIIKNDNWTYIGDLSDKYYLASGEGRIEVVLEEA